MNKFDISKTGKFIIASYIEGCMVLYSFSSGDVIRIYDLKNNKNVIDIKFNSLGDRFISGYADGRIIVWKVDSGDKILDYQSDVSIKIVIWKDNFLIDK